MIQFNTCRQLSIVICEMHNTLRRESFLPQKFQMVAFANYSHLKTILPYSVRQCDIKLANMLHYSTQTLTDS